MEENNNGPETSHLERIHRHVQQIHARETHERKIFMDDLQEYRRKKAKNMLMCIKKEVGPRWYQALSVLQRRALDKLSSSIYQDILEGRPKRSANIMRHLGLYPRPNTFDLFTCVYAGRDDPKEMLAQLYLFTYGYPIEAKQASYCLNARLMLSGILYLGLDSLIHLLRERFKPDVVLEPPPKPKPKPEPPAQSPYLQRFVAKIYEKPKYQRPPPPPLPNSDDLNEPYEEEPIVPKPPPPPPPPPPPKKRLPRSLCDRLANFHLIEPYQADERSDIGRVRSFRSQRKIRRSSKLGTASSTNLVKRKYGIGLEFSKKGVRRRKPVAPMTGLANAQYNINGVYIVKGKALYVLGNVSILPPQGDLIHGGFANKDGVYINVHCGFRGRPPPPKPDPCDCAKKWQDIVFNYINENKCVCRHRYDYGNEGQFLSDEVPFFIKPTRHSPLQFNYHTIFDLDPAHQYVEKKFKNVWETESMLYVEGVDNGDIVKKDKGDKKKKRKKSSKTCLSQFPTTEDYLKCALRFMRKVNIAARLPDLHLVPELKEWMRYRLHGPLTSTQRAELLRKSTTYWRMFTTLSDKGFGHVSPPPNPLFTGHVTSWADKHSLNKEFRLFTHKYKLALYRSHAYVTNLLWRSMYQAEFPDKKFREIYFSYLFGRLEDWQILHPYDSREATDRMLKMMTNRYVCLPSKVEKKT